MTRRTSGLIGTVALALASLLAVGPEAAEAQDWRTVNLSRQDDGIADARVKVTYGAGRFTVGPAGHGLLYDMQLHYDAEHFEPVADWDGRRLELGVEGRGRNIRLGNGRDQGELQLGLARGVPMDLTLEFGAVQADLDLGGLQLTGLDLSTGASESTLDVSEPNPTRIKRAVFEVGAADFTARRLGNLHAQTIEVSAGVGSLTLWLNGEWEEDSRVAVKMGLGSLELRVPEGLGLRLNKESFLTSLDADGLEKRGDSYYSADWDEAERRVTVDLNAAFGGVEVSWVR